MANYSIGYGDGYDGYPDEAPEPKDKWDESNITW